MQRNGKEIKDLFCQIDAELFDDLKKYCETTKLNKNRVVENALKDFFERGDKC